MHIFTSYANKVVTSMYQEPVQIESKIRGSRITIVQPLYPQAAYVCMILLPDKLKLYIHSALNLNTRLKKKLHDEILYRLYN